MKPRCPICHRRDRMYEICGEFICSRCESDASIIDVLAVRKIMRVASEVEVPPLSSAQ
jgi:hypothetical protein